MGVQVTLRNILGQFLSAAGFNANNSDTEAAFNKALDRTDTVDNAMEATLDMGLNTIINLSHLDMSARKIVGLPIPTESTEATNKAYVDAGDLGAAIGAGSQYNLGTVSSVDRTVGSRLQERASLADFNPVADGITDDADAFSNFLQGIHDEKIHGYIGPGDYAISFVHNRTLTNSVQIFLHPEARIIGLPTKQVFSSTDSLFTVTIWTKATAFLVTHIDSGNNETAFKEGTQYSVSGQDINLTGGSSPNGPLLAGESIRVSESQGMLQIGAATQDASSFEWIGGFIDSSARGYQLNEGSGSALTLYNFSQCHVRDGWYFGSEDYEAAHSNGVSDSGITTLSCSNVEISGNLFQGFADLGFYGTGSGSLGTEDDGFGYHVHSNRFLKCFGGVSVKRGGQNASISGNSFESCRTGVSLVPTTNIANGGKGSITGNTFLRTGRSAVDCRGSTGVITANNVIIDYGRKLNGVTPETATVAAIEYLGISDGRIADNVITLLDWSVDSQIAIQLGRDSASTNDSTNCVVTGNNINGASIGYDENNAGTGNIWKSNNILNVTTPVSVLSTRKWHYTKSNVDFDGIGTKSFSGAFTPTALFAGASSTINYTVQQGRYVRKGNKCWVNVKIQFDYTGTSPASQLRITGLPYAAKNTAGQESTGSLGFTDGPLTLPASTYQIVPKIPANATYVRLDALRSGLNPLIIGSDDIATSLLLRVEYTIEYEVEPEAQN